MKNYTGVNGDPTKSPKFKSGYRVEEVVAMSSPVAWKKKSKLRSYPVWNQHKTSACVAFSKAKQVSIALFLETGVWIDFSPAFIYQKRFNRPAEGMSIPNANEIVNVHGTTLEALMKSQGLTEAQIHAVQSSKVADLFAKAVAEAVVSPFYFDNPADIDAIARAIDSGMAVSLLLFADGSREYGNSMPVIRNKNLKYNEASIRHEVVAVDYHLVDGKKCLRIEDSAHFGGVAVRDITEEFLKARCVMADGLGTVAFTSSPTTKTRAPITKNLAYGDRDPEVVVLQQMLQREGFFPSDWDTTGFYGNLTAQAVLAWQKKYNVDTVAELNRLGGKFFGPKSRAAMKT